MNILFLTQILPYPPDAGPRVKTWHVLRSLASRGHRILLVSFIRPEEEPYVSALRDVCAEVYTIPIRRSQAKDALYWLKSNFSGRPFLVERDDLPAMRSLVAQLVAGGQIDVIHADQLTMAQFGLSYARGRSGRPLRLIFDAHNAVWTIVERMRQNAPAPLRPLAALEARRVKRHEGQILLAFDHTLAVAEPDRLALQEAVKAAGGRAEDAAITVVPIAVDTQQLQPLPRPVGTTSIVTLGTLHYPPNADGIRWFVKDVFPLVRQEIPAATLTIIGKNPPPDFQQLAQREPGTIQVTGYVHDLTPYMQPAGVLVVPVRAGGGMRVRILEAFARGLPVVTTTVGLEGIDAQPEEDVLIGDTPQEFARQTIRILHDPRLQSTLATNGRRLAERCYDWQVVLGRMEPLYLP